MTDDQELHVQPGGIDDGRGPGIPPAPDDGAAPAARAKATAPIGRIVAIAIGIVGLLASALFAVNAGSHAGASSPEDAVRELTAALAAEDVLGMLEIVEPGERAVLVDVVTDVTTELERLDVLAPDLDLGAISGVDIEFSGLGFRTEELSGDVAAVFVTEGTIRTTTRPADAPIGDLLADYGVDLSDEKPETTTEDAKTDDPIVAVKRGGGWFVSLGYSIAEAGRRESGAPFPTAPLEPLGAASPEEAVLGLFDAIDALDLEEMIRRLPPGEMSALQQYAPLFLDDAQDAIDDAEDGGFAFEVTKVELGEPQGDGDIVRVPIEELALAAEIDGGSIAISVGECTKVDVEPPDGVDAIHQEICPGETPTGFGTDNPFNGMLLGFQKVFADALDELNDSKSGFTAVEIDGHWYVSPVRSLFDPIVTVLRALDEKELRDIIDTVQDAFADFGAAMFGTDAVGSSESFDSIGGVVTPGGYDQAAFCADAREAVARDELPEEALAQFGCAA